MLQAKRAGPLAAGALAFPGGGSGPAGAPPRGPSASPEAAGAPHTLASPGVPRGRVASVHRRAVNLALESGDVVALLPEGTPVHPWAVTAPFDPAALRVGGEFSAPAGVLCVGPLRVSLEVAEVADLRLRARPDNLPASATSGLAERADASDRERPAGPFQPALRGALARFRDGGEVAALVSLVGLGEGLTPSGDDALVGVLAGLDLARGVSPAAGSAHAALAAALAPLLVRPGPGAGAGPPRTSALSAQMLTAAAHGLYAEPVLNVMRALAGASPAAGQLDAALAGLLAMGHHSGADTLRGIAAALGRR